VWIADVTRKPREPLDPQTIDALYGLEPVFEPGGAGSSQFEEFVTIQCPYCGERFETAVDLSAGSFSYVEDCQVCCQPIELVGLVDEAGALVGVSANRAG
jgi:hypothetical protein